MQVSRIAAALALTCATWLPAVAQDKPIELKLAHWVPPSHPLQKAMEDWGASLSKEIGRASCRERV